MAENYRGFSCGLSPHSNEDHSQSGREGDSSFLQWGWSGEIVLDSQRHPDPSHCLEESHWIQMWARSGVNGKWISIRSGPLFILTWVVVTAAIPRGSLLPLPITPPLLFLWIYSLLPWGCQPPRPASGQLPSGSCLDWLIDLIWFDLIILLQQAFMGWIFILY